MSEWSCVYPTGSGLLPFSAWRAAADEDDACVGSDLGDLPYYAAVPVPGSGAGVDDFQGANFGARRGLSTGALVGCCSLVAGLAVSPVSGVYRWYRGGWWFSVCRARVLRVGREFLQLRMPASGGCCVSLMLRHGSCSLPPWWSSPRCQCGFQWRDASVWGVSLRMWGLPMPALVRMRRTVGRLRSMLSRSLSNSVRWVWLAPS